LFKTPKPNQSPAQNIMVQKRELLESVVESCKLPRVTKVLATLPPSEPRDLLLESLPHATEIGGEKRHPFQTEVLKMAVEMMGVVRTAAAETQTGLVAQAAQATASSTTATETFAACKQRQEAAALDRDGCAALALQAEEAHANAEYEQSRSEAARGRIMEERVKLDAEKAESEKFLEGGWEGMDANLVQEQLKAIGAEPALIAAVPGALAVHSEHRGAFDALTTQALTSSLKDRAQIVESMILKNQQGEKSASSFALGAWAFADMAKGQAASAAEKVADSEDALAAVTAELKKCNASVKAEDKTLQAALGEQALADDKVQEIDSAMDELQHVIVHDTIQPVAAVQEFSMETEDKEVPLVSPVPAKSDELPATAVISPESISIGGC